MKKIKVAFVIPNALPVPSVMGGAIEQLATILIEENEKYQNLDIDVYSCYTEDSLKIASNYKHTRVVPFTKEKFFPAFFIKVFNTLAYKFFKIPLLFRTPCYKKLTKLVTSNPPDVLVSFYCDLKQLKMISKYIGPKKMVVYNHYCCFATPRYDYIFGNVISISNYCKNVWEKTTSQKLYNSYLLRNCIDELRFSRNITEDRKLQIRSKFGWDKDDFVIIYCGRVLEIKGCKELVQAVIKANNKNIKLLIIGGNNALDSKYSKFEKQLSYLVKGNEDNIKFTGYVKNTDLYEYYKSSDLQIIPSICEEAAGVVAIEGMACGLPLIVTNSGGLPEYVEESKAFVLNKKDALHSSIDSEDLSCQLKNSILELYSNQKERKEMSSHSMQASKNFTKKIYYDNFVKIMTDIYQKSF